MKLHLISEASLSDIAHVGLDVAGLVPIFGEAADFTNAMLYIKEKKYLFAALSFISLVPEIGDLIGKGIKYLAKNKGLAAKYLSAHVDKLDRAWDRIAPALQKVAKIRPYVREMQLAMDNLLADIRQADSEQEDEEIT